MLIFGRKHLTPFSKVDKLQIFSNKYFATWKISINRVFLAKKQKGWSHKLEFFEEKNEDFFKKYLENEKFVSAAFHCEIDIWNIQIFAMFFFSVGFKSNITAWFMMCHSTRPQQKIALHCSQIVVRVDYGY